ncbi:amidohydrolase family protein [Haloechinothrix sp. YIM 98757]|uniref:Amidohydrolase family protein n=1 Tax=Haloechinothrix aidingensis TaxID=2752311 RepID=A0A838AEJ2_9PSEU|nr:amidohydrolase family protein [Haloechinothrix aidingensis]MBA0127587.1 amidohydrolase family protein [Haloechinothrix aidingensis]
MAAVDLHVHLAPALDADGLRIPGIGRAVDGRLTADGAPLGPPALYDADQAEAYLDRAGLDEAVVSIPPPFFRQGLPCTAQWVRAVNHGLLRVTQERTRLRPLAYLPLEEPELAADEYERVRDDERFAGVCGPAGGRSISLADTRFDALWKGLDAERRLLLLHPGASPDDRLEEFYLHNLLGNPVETTVATAQLVFGDVLARYPGLRLLLVHCGGCVPAVAGRWQRGSETGRPGVEVLTESPRRALRRVFVDCLAHDPGLVDQAVSVFGADRVVLGSDWPFTMGTDDPRYQVAHRGPAFVNRVATANAAAALGW